MMKRKSIYYIFSILVLLTIFAGASVPRARAEKLSDWVDVSNALNQSSWREERWVYDRTTYQDSRETSLSGYRQYSSEWVQSGSGWTNYASFPYGFDTGHWIYTSFAKGPYTEYEYTTSKRSVSNNRAGWVYWHWMYEVAGTNDYDALHFGLKRAYDNVCEWNSASGLNLYFCVFRAFTSGVDLPKPPYPQSYCNSKSLTSYDATQLYYSGLWQNDGQLRFMRFDYYTSAYTDYYKLFHYVKEEKDLISSSYVSASNGISNVRHQVRYVMENTVKFNANGGTVNTSSKTVSYGSSIGSLPVPTMEHYDFVGWFTGSGTQANESTVVTSDMTLTARWNLTTHTVTFDANGGTVEPSSKTVSHGSAIGSLPVPKREHYKPVGWFTGSGTQVNESTVVTSDMTLTARWELETHTVTFDANGGTVDPSSKTVSHGSAIGSLPVPTMEHYDFVGWFTGSGTQVNESTVVTSDMTLTARWNKSTFLFDVMGDAYFFDNSMRSFGYISKGPGFDYPIPVQSFQLLLGDNVRAKSIYRKVIQNMWGGNCAGMSATLDLLYTAIGVTPGDFGKSMTFLLSVDDINKNSVEQYTVKSFIEAMQIAQYTEKFIKERSKNEIRKVTADNAHMLEALYNQVQTDGQDGKATLLAIVKEGVGGHALLALYGEDTKDGNVKLRVYDCNYPGQKRYMTLYKDDSGNFTGWSYDMGGNSGVWENHKDGVRGCNISYITHDTLKYIWENRGTGALYSEILTVNAENLSILDYRNEEVARLVDGRLETNQPDIYEVVELSMIWPEERTISLPRDYYTIVSHDDGELSAEMVDTNLSASVTTTANAVTFAVDDNSQMNEVSINVSAAGDTFAVTLESGRQDTQYETVEVSGVGKSTSGTADGEETVTISMNGDTLSLPPAIESLYVNGVEYQGVYEIKSVVVNSPGTVTADISNSADATAIAMFYGTDGQYLGMSSTPAPANCGSVTLSAPAATLSAPYRVQVTLTDNLTDWRVLCRPCVAQTS